MPGLDIRTLLVGIALILGTLAVVQLFAFASRRSERALLLWGAGNLVCTIGVILVVLRGSIPDLLSIVAANSMIIAGLLIYWSGMRVEAGQRPLPAVVVAFAVVTVLLLGVPSPVSESLVARIAVVSAAIAAISTLIGLAAWRSDPSGESMVARGVTAIFVAHAAVFVYRIVAVVPPSPIKDFLLPNDLQALILVASSALLLAGNVGALLMVNDRLHRAVTHAAAHDWLTGTLNREALQETAERLIGRARLAGETIGVLLIDLDHFKRINDTFGHPAGDQVLRRVADALAGALRPNDLIGRFGGEEFCVVLPGADVDRAEEIANRLREAVRAVEPYDPAAPIHITISAGATIVGPDEADLDAAVRRADVALYRAKHLGRDRVVPEPVALSTPAV